MSKPRHFLFTGGGTGGHVIPALPVIDALLADGHQVSFIGSNSGLEQRLLGSRAVRYQGISSGKLRRYFSWANLTDAFRVLLGIVQAVWWVGRLRPDAVFSKGGFVAFPVVFAAWLWRVPVVAHESDYSPGLANRLSQPFVHTLATSFLSDAFAGARRVLHAGTPLRPELLAGDAARGRAHLGVSDQPILLVFGGSLGADRLNEVTRSALPELLQRFVVVHVCGAGKLNAAQETTGYFQFEFVTEEWPDLLAAADVVVSRAGANSVFELLSLRKVHLLVPLSAAASRGDQIENARFCAEQGYSLVLQEDALNAQSLLAAVTQLARDATDWQARLGGFAPPDAVSVLTELLLELASPLANSKMRAPLERAGARVKFKVRTYNNIAVRGLQRFPQDRFEVASEMSAADAILLRSHKLAVEELPVGLRAVARAGAGVNNLPLDACTDRGIVVFNTPGANANSVKELVLTCMLLASRDVFGGIEYVRSLGSVGDEAELNRLVEAEKKRFKGRELAGKSLGVVGLGAIGSLVARAALDLGMSVYGYDPAISVDAAWRLPSEVRRMENLPSLFSRSDYVTLHVPLLPATTGLINRESLSAFRPGSVLLNFARQPIVDTSALMAALDEGHVSRYIADFPVPGLTDHKRVLLTPHLGASTEEAEENCAVMAAEQLIDFFQTGRIANSVNFPLASLEASSGWRVAITNHNSPGLLGNITSILAERKINVVDLLNKSRDEVAYNLIDLDQPADELLLAAIAKVEGVINVRSINL